MDFLKEIDKNSGVPTITKEKVAFSGTGSIVLTSSDLRFTLAERTDITDREFSNLFVSLNLPVADVDKLKFEAGGQFFNTNFSGFNVDKIVVVEIPKDKYGELIDGKTFKLTVPTGVTGFDFVDIYGTYENQQRAISYYNKLTSESSIKSSIFGQPQFDFEGKVINPKVSSEPYNSNIVFLYSNNIKRPKGDASLSWATNYSNSSNSKPFSTVNNSKKELFDFSQDIPVGIAYLDKGLVALTHPLIVNNFYTGGTSLMTGAANTNPKFTQLYFPPQSASTSYYSFNYEYALNLVCIAGPNEFFTTTNPTAAQLVGDSGSITSFKDDNIPVVITEIALYDKDKNLVGIAKPNVPIKKYDFENVVFNIRIKI